MRLISEKQRPAVRFRETGNVRHNLSDGCVETHLRRKLND